MREQISILQLYKIVYNIYQWLIIDVIHTVGPQGIKPEKLQSCYNTSLRILTEQNLRTIVSIEASRSNIK